MSTESESISTRAAFVRPICTTLPKMASTFAAALPAPSQMVSALAPFSVVMVSRLVNPSRKSWPSELMSTFPPVWLSAQSSRVDSVT